jgi:hypothetical protein
MFSVAGIRSNYRKIAGVTPERLFHRKNGRALFDG